MTTMSPDEIRRALWDNHRLPYGAARNAQAETLAAAAEATGDRALLRQALTTQIDAYEYSSERTRMVVPFARLLQEYDRDPAAFDSGETHSLFWRFKWVAGRIVESPEIPVAAVTGWLDDMERRYRLAGYSERAVRQSEFYLADAIGDDERAERAITRWAAADRDRMSDCHACETNTQGWFWARKGEDAKAVEVWEPVLSGNQTCMEEPHRVLARSLLPLVRLGRVDEARAHHLRGYRMVRGKDSLLRSIGEHIEFCALTGNEARGLEILADHAGQLAPLADVGSQMEFYGGVLVLLHRLIALGHGEQPTVPYAGSPRTVAGLYEVLRAEALDIARRYDVRNGHTRVSDELVARIAAAPVLDVLPLGVRSAALPRPAADAGAGAGTATGTVPRAAAGGAKPAAVAEFGELVARARAARAQGHPSAGALWDEVDRRAQERQQEQAREPDAALAADLLEHRAMAAARAGAPDLSERFARVRDAHRAAGQEQRAALAELHLATAAVQSGAAPEEVRALLAAAMATARALPADEPLRARRIARAELTGIRIAAYLSGEADGAGEPGPSDAPDAWVQIGEPGEGGGTRAGLEAFVADHGPDPELAVEVSEAEEMLAHLALEAGDAERGQALLASAAERVLAADRPWLAVDPLATRGTVLLQLGRPAEAEEAARAALAHAVELTDPERHGALRLSLADMLLRRDGDPAEAAALALESAHWFDQAGLTEGAGAQARLWLARAYAADGRKVEAVEVLQSALPDLLEHGEQQAVFARERLGELLADLHDQRAAAEQYLLAAETAQGWEHQGAHARLAQSAADALQSAGLREEAVAAYERALRLRRELGDAPVSVVRILRSLAWLELRDEVTNATVAAARGRMEEAAQVLRAAQEEFGDDPRLRYELAQTWQQLAQVLDRRVDAYVDQDEDDYDEEDETEDGADHDHDDEVADDGREPLTATELRALRLEAVALWDRAAGLYAGLGPESLPERFQCLNGIVWTERALGDVTGARVRLKALVEEVRTLTEGTAPDWLLPRAEYMLTSLDEE
ncbi:tetratricopeptide repeat protein [Streptomyces antimicrobicus]|uniref:Tetratricopeptide repeat protein n=1 Tax=Streptomyces antimicrobicus TaxID=2883108 RepID=A0ABS8B0D0_9ACTN|nr:tetratricopeptide repeat protein [Streptomyces antimicrobicus]MCB5178041.1 tetratricopeptide repeat protein [Streptomyces antimicrobicus]